MRVNTLYGTKEVETDEGERMELRYYLIQDIRSAWEDGPDRQARESDKITYGIRIVKTEAGRQEQECLVGLSYAMDPVERLLRQMVYGLVTPATAAAVADDWAAAR